jgi:hypothetical protein
MSLNFRESLDKTVDSIEKPPLGPTGTYVFVVMREPELQEDIQGRDGNSYDFLNFLCKAVDATDDVDAQALADFGDIGNIIIRHSFIFNKNDAAAFGKSEYALRRFLEEHLQVPFEGVPLKKALHDSVNVRFLGNTIWKPRKDEPDTFDHVIKSTAPVNAG